LKNQQAGRGGGGRGGGFQFHGAQDPFKMFEDIFGPGGGFSGGSRFTFSAGGGGFGPGGGGGFSRGGHQRPRQVYNFDGMHRTVRKLSEARFPDASSKHIWFVHFYTAQVRKRWMCSRRTPAESQRGRRTRSGGGADGFVFPWSSGDPVETRASGGGGAPGAEAWEEREGRGARLRLALEFLSTPTGPGRRIPVVHRRNARGLLGREHRQSLSSLHLGARPLRLCEQPAALGAGGRISHGMQVQGVRSHCGMELALLSAARCSPSSRYLSVSGPLPASFCLRPSSRRHWS